MYGPRLRTYAAMPAAAVCSRWLPRVVRPLPCRRATRAKRVLSSIMLLLTPTYDATNAVFGLHDSGHQPSNGFRFESRVTRSQCRQRVVAMRGLAHAAGKIFVMALSQPREVWPTRCTPGWSGSLPTARAPQPTHFGCTGITRARLPKVVATSRHASSDAKWLSDGSRARSFVPKWGPRRFRG